jgi:hypothetical protein
VKLERPDIRMWVSGKFVLHVVENAADKELHVIVEISPGVEPAPNLAENDRGIYPQPTSATQQLISQLRPGCLSGAADYLELRCRPVLNPLIPVSEKPAPASHFKGGAIDPFDNRVDRFETGVYMCCQDIFIFMG